MLKLFKYIIINYIKPINKYIPHLLKSILVVLPIKANIPNIIAVTKKINIIDE